MDILCNIVDGHWYSQWQKLKIRRACRPTGPNICNSLSAYHEFTGTDYTSAIIRNVKVKLPKRLGSSTARCPHQNSSKHRGNLTQLRSRQNRLCTTNVELGQFHENKDKVAKMYIFTVSFYTTCTNTSN